MLVSGWFGRRDDTTRQRERKMYKFLSIEDDAPEERSLANCVRRYMQENRLQAKLDWHSRISQDELAQISGRYDLIFMDIDLPNQNGLDAAAALRAFDKVTPLVFVTNLARFAVRGYEVDALDFIVKPLAYENFSFRRDRIIRRIERKPARKVAIRTPEGCFLVPSSDIEHVVVSGHRLSYRVIGYDNRLVSRGSIRELEHELADERFTRISNEALINPARVSQLRADSVRMESGEVLYFSRSRKKAALEAMARFLGASQ